MQDSGAPRRQQYSSCDGCRRARVACDAGRLGRTEDGNRICSRCSSRKQTCTFDWMREAKLSQSTRTAHKSNVRAQRARTTSVDTNASEQCCRGWQQASNASSAIPSIAELSDQHNGWLAGIYSATWEQVFGNWLSRYSCPFVFGDDSVAESHISIVDLCTQLDQWIAADPTTATSPRTYTGQFDISTDDETDKQAHESLQTMLRAYTARWLPLLPDADDAASTKEIATRLWREARTRMLKVINRPSYRAMLTLYLFGLTPVPEGISEEEEHDGISGHVCVQAALQQVNQLRARQKSMHFSGAKVSPSVSKSRSITNASDPLASKSFIDAENIVHWAAITFDTSASLTLSARPILSSGLFGFENDPCWSLVRSCTDMFQSMSRDWDLQDMTESKANQVVAAGAAFKLLMWKLSAVFREALRDGHDEKLVQRVHGLIIDAFDKFNATYRDLLSACQRRIHFLSQELKLRWYVLMLHHNLSILLAIDAIEAYQRHDLLAPLSAARNDAESCTINALAFGMNTTYNISFQASDSDGSPPRPHDQITVPLLAIDPYPHHVVAAVQLMHRAIQRDNASEAIDSVTYTSLASMLHRVLHLLPDSSKSVQAARVQLESQGSAD